ncbi:MAG: hypothetical protein ACYC6B_09135 [Thermoleophilia bacterium]
MKKFVMVLVVLIVSTFGSPFASVAFAREKAEKTVTECVCPDGHHCPNGNHNGHHKNARGECVADD